MRHLKSGAIAGAIGMAAGGVILGLVAPHQVADGIETRLIMLAFWTVYLPLGVLGFFLIGGILGWLAGSLAEQYGRRGDHSIAYAASAGLLPPIGFWIYIILTGGLQRL